MAMTFDFNALTALTLETTMPGGEVFHLTDPTVELLERFEVATKDARIIAETKDVQTIRAVYELFAEVFSNNLERKTFTAEELRDKYRLTLAHLVAFMPQYLEFIATFKTAKN